MFLILRRVAGTLNAAANCSRPGFDRESESPFAAVGIARTASGAPSIRRRPMVSRSHLTGENWRRNAVGHLRTLCP